MKRKELLQLLLLVAIIVFAAWRFMTRSYEIKDSQILLDTFVEVSIKTSDKNAKALIDSTFNLMRDYEKRLSYFKDGSEIVEMNSSEDTQFLLSPDVQEMMTLGATLYTKTDSLYDLSIGVLSDLWDFEKKIVPDSSAIADAQSHVGFDKLSLDGTNLTRPVGMKINLGSVAKGYIIDRAVEYLISKGVLSGFINAGGDIRYFGDTGKMRVGIRHPREMDGIIAVLNLEECAVVTSGDYERFFMQDSVRYHHIINPKTGFPAQNTISVTVIAPNATLADALSTAMFLLKPEKAIELAKSFPGVNAIIYSQEGDEIISMRTMGVKDFLESDDSN